MATPLSQQRSKGHSMLAYGSEPYIQRRTPSVFVEMGLIDLDRSYSTYVEHGSQGMRAAAGRVPQLRNLEWLSIHGQDVILLVRSLPRHLLLSRFISSAPMYQQTL